MASLIAPALENYSAIEDVEAIRKACEGWGTDERVLIMILGHRNAAQRRIIMQTYEQTYQEDLIKRLESELSGDFEQAVCRWVLEPADRYAVLANLAIKKLSSDFNVIVEIASTNSPEELLAIRRAYKIRYKHSLEEDVASHSSGDIRKLLVALVSAYRYEGTDINVRLANTEADILQDHIIKKKEYNHEEVTRILTTRSTTQIMASLNRYREENKGTTITKALEKAPANEFLGLLRTTIQCLNNPAKYYEKVLRNAVKNMGTDENALTRVIVTRAEKDLKTIKEVYYKRNSVSLDQTIEKETSGDYKHFLLTLVGNETYV